MLSHETVLALVERIYDAAADATLWPEFLRDFADAANGTTTALLFYDWSAPGAKVNYSAVRYDPDYARRYAEYYSTVNPWIKAWKTHLNSAGPESIGISEERVEFAQLVKTEFYNDHLLPQDTVHQMACMIATTEQRSSGFTCQRPHKAGPFGPAEVELLRLLFPHLQRAVQFRTKMSELEGHHQASLDALDRLPTGVILIDAKGRILTTNRAAQHILNQNDGLVAQKAGLAASNPSLTRELRSMIAAAALTASGKGVSAGGSLAIARPSGKRPFGVVVMPASPRAFSPDATGPAVIVFVSDPEARVQTPPQVLAQAYDLTAAESRLAGQLMKGESLVHAAEQLGVSHNTVRTHLQRIYDKTGTAHQGDLIRLLLGGVANLLLDRGES